MAVLHGIIALVLCAIVIRILELRVAQTVEQTYAEPGHYRTLIVFVEKIPGLV